MTITIVDRINDYIKKNNISKSELANTAKVSKSYISMLLKNERTPNVELLCALSKMSKKSINWWLYGNDIMYELQNLNELIDVFIEKGYIHKDGTMEDIYKKMIIEMLMKEIKLKLEKAQD